MEWGGVIKRLFFCKNKLESIHMLLTMNENYIYSNFSDKFVGRKQESFQDELSLDNDSPMQS